MDSVKSDLVTVTTELAPAPLEPGKELSIWDAPAWPTVFHAIKWTPAELKAAIDEYRTTTKSLVECLKRHKINVADAYLVAGQHCQVREAMLKARIARADLYDNAQDQITKRPPSYEEAPYLYQADREGNKVLTAAAIKWLELRHRHYAARAAQAETGTRIQRQQIETKNLHVHATASNNIPAKQSEPLHHKSLDDLLGDLRGLSVPKTD